MHKDKITSSTIIYLHFLNIYCSVKSNKIKFKVSYFLRWLFSLWTISKSIYGTEPNFIRTQFQEFCFEKAKYIKGKLIAKRDPFLRSLFDRISKLPRSYSCKLGYLLASNFGNTILLLRTQVDIFTDVKYCIHLHHKVCPLDWSVRCPYRVVFWSFLYTPYYTM